MMDRPVGRLGVSRGLVGRARTPPRVSLAPLTTLVLSCRPILCANFPAEEHHESWPNSQPPNGPTGGRIGGRSTWSWAVLFAPFPPFEGAAVVNASREVEATSTRGCSLTTP